MRPGHRLRTFRWLFNQTAEQLFGVEPRSEGDAFVRLTKG